MVANLHLAQVVGVETPEELQGKTDFDFYPRELANAFDEDEQNVIRSEMPLYNREERGIDHAGNAVDILTTKVPVRDKKGHVIGIARRQAAISQRARKRRTRFARPSGTTAEYSTMQSSAYFRARPTRSAFSA